MKCTFVVGQRVVCIADRFITDEPDFPHPQRGDICKIRAMHAGVLVLPANGHKVKCPSGVWLALMHPYGWFCSSEFRPLQQRPTQTDISVFRKLLTQEDVHA